MLEIPRMFACLFGKVPPGHLWYLWRRMKYERPHRFDSQVRINTFFPPWPSPAFTRFCRHIAARSRVPLSVYFAVTPHCPFKCSHCSIARRSSDEMSHETALDVISQIRKLGACTVGFTGGEPLLRKDLPELVASLEGDLTSIVFTTGWGLTPQLAKRLKAAGLDCVTVGMEASSPAEHDAARCFDGSFAAAEKAIKTAQDAGIYTAISTVGTRERINSGEVEKMYELAAKWGVYEFRLLAPVATGAKAGCASFMLTADEREKLAEFHRSRNATKTGPAVASFAYLESAELFGCGAGYHHLFIDHAGEVCPCDLTPLSFGNCTKKPLEEIWREMAKNFPLPRCACIMHEISKKLDSNCELPLPKEQSYEMAPPPDKHAPLPKGYAKLLK